MIELAWLFCHCTGMDPVQAPLVEQTARQAAAERAATCQRRGKRKMGERPEGEMLATAATGHHGIPASMSIVATAMVPMSQPGMETVGLSGGLVSISRASS